QDVSDLLEMIESHYRHTQSPVARRVLDHWPHVLEQFVKVMPIDYKRVLLDRAKHDEEIESIVHREAHVDGR
ncbi:MAG: hypothetical protein KY475_20155, partial [Planctomycetes bacterium]|nr:hypothetical protein [Planctomycetota bacterium]